jgi:putative membrane protein
MILEFIVALILGIAIGTITGLTPGIHINLVSAIILASSSLLLLHLEPIIIAIFLVSMAISHTFSDFIPSIFLGAPDQDDTSLSILPGHQMLLEGQAYSGVVLTLYGCVFALVLLVIISPIFFYFLPIVYPYANRIMPFILILASFFLIYFEKGSKFFAIIIFILSGFLGLISLNIPIKETLLPLFTGLFGISSIITSISKKQTLPLQQTPKLREIKLEKKSFLKSIVASIIASPFCSFLPGMGSGQASIIGSEVTGDLTKKEFLFVLGAINTLVTGLSFVTLYSINKARTGIAVAVGKIIHLTPTNLLTITLTIILAGIFSFFLTILLAKLFSKILNKINYTLISSFVLIFLIIIVIAFSGFLGFLLMLVSSLLGLACIHLGVRRTHLMGCLLIPAIVLGM